MKDIEKTGFEQLAKVVNMPTRFECYETMGDIAKLALLAYFAGSRDACGWIKKKNYKRGGVTMKQVEIWGALNIDDALKMVKAEAEKLGCVCWAGFNMEKIYSTDSIDEAYLKVCGCTKAEHDEKVRKEQEEWERQEREHKANIPALTEQYRKEARGLVIEEELEFWDKCVPIRLNDLYQGMELGCTLSIIRVMKDESISLDERLVKAHRVFDSQGHSGMSARLMFSMLYKFCPNGEKLVEYLRK